MTRILTTIRAIFSRHEGWGGHIDNRSPSHILSAATRKANQRDHVRETTMAMRAHLQREGRLRA